jgi:hypothetical protein
MCAGTLSAFERLIAVPVLAHTGPLVITQLLTKYKHNICVCRMRYVDSGTRK